MACNECDSARRTAALHQEKGERVVHILELIKAMAEMSSSGGAPHLHKQTLKSIVAVIDQEMDIPF